jgi:hypothetical protein
MRGYEYTFDIFRGSSDDPVWIEKVAGLVPACEPSKNSRVSGRAPISQRTARTNRSSLKSTTALYTSPRRLCVSARLSGKNCL